MQNIMSWAYQSICEYQLELLEFPDVLISNFTISASYE